MFQSFHLDATPRAARMRWFLGLGWVLIVAKCAVVWWAMTRWHVPMHPGWIVLPTLLFASLVTALWFGVHDD
jgi:hypothetical protein